MRVAVIGTGAMGGGMAHCLLAAEHDVSVFDVRPEALGRLRTQGARVTSSPMDAADGAEFVITSLPRDHDVRDALTLGRESVIHGLSGGEIIIETSTVSPRVSRELQPGFAAVGASLIDAPLVTSQISERRPVPEEFRDEAMNIGREAAVSGNLCFLVGGDETDVDAAAPLLRDLGLEYHHLGPVGSGATVKLINNAIVGSQVAMLSELMVLGRSEGLDLVRLADVLSLGSANSGVLNTHIRRFTVKDEFPEGVFPVEYMLKDMSLALSLAEESGLSLEVVTAARDLFGRALDMGFGHIYNPVAIKAVRSRSEPQGPVRESERGPT